MVSDHKMAEDAKKDSNGNTKQKLIKTLNTCNIPWEWHCDDPVESNEDVKEIPAPRMENAILSVAETNWRSMEDIQEVDDGCCEGGDCMITRIAVSSIAHPWFNIRVEVERPRISSGHSQLQRYDVRHARHSHVVEKSWPRQENQSKNHSSNKLKTTSKWSLKSQQGF